MTLETLKGKHVHVVIGRNQKDDVKHGILQDYDESFIYLKFKSGDMIPVGRRYIIEIVPERESGL